MSDFYLDSLSLQEELPRLASVSRITYPAIAEFLKGQALPETQDRVLLDLGSGPGIFTGLIAKHFPGFTIHGVDRSRGLVDFAKTTLPKFQWIQADARELPYGDSSMSYLISHFSLVHMPEPEKVFSEMDRVLQSSGKILLVEPDLPASDTDGLIQELFQEHRKITLSNEKAVYQAKQFFLERNYQVEKETLVRLVSTGKMEEPPRLAYPDVELGRMGIWSLFSCMGQLLQLRDIYNECLEKYMRKEISIRAIHLPTLLLTKK